MVVVAIKGESTEKRITYSILNYFMKLKLFCEKYHGVLKRNILNLNDTLKIYQLEYLSFFVQIASPN